MNNPKNLSYTKSHEWVEWIDGKTARVGLTDFAQHSLGDLVFVNLPEVGDKTEEGKSFADVESVKAVSDVYSPVTGTVTEVNSAVLDDPAAINGDPYGAWLAVIGDVTAKEDFLTAEEYAAFCESEEAGH